MGVWRYVGMGNVLQFCILFKTSLLEVRRYFITYTFNYFQMKSNLRDRIIENMLIALVGALFSGAYLLYISNSLLGVSVSGAIGAGIGVYVSTYILKQDGSIFYRITLYKFADDILDWIIILISIFLFLICLTGGLFIGLEYIIPFFNPQQKETGLIAFLSFFGGLMLGAFLGFMVFAGFIHILGLVENRIKGIKNE